MFNRPRRSQTIIMSIVAGHLKWLIWQSKRDVVVHFSGLDHSASESLLNEFTSQIFERILFMMNFEYFKIDFLLVLMNQLLEDYVKKIVEPQKWG